MKQRPILTYEQANQLEHLRVKDADVDLVSMRMNNSLAPDTELSDLSDDEFVSALYNGYLVLPFIFSGTRPSLTKEEAKGIEEFIEHGQGMQISHITYHHKKVEGGLRMNVPTTVELGDIELINLLAAIQFGYVLKNH